MEAGYVLHKRRYQETSLIVQLLTKEHGRITCVAKGALRRKSKLAGILEPLCLLKVETKGRSSLLNLVRAEVSYRHSTLVDNRLFAVFYLNELIVKLTAENDNLPGLFELYSRSLEGLATEKNIQLVLRNFEVNFLKILGFGLSLAFDCQTDEDIITDNHYTYDIEMGATRTQNTSLFNSVKGSTLLALSGKKNYDDADLYEAKILMRRVLQYYLGERRIESRDLFRVQKRNSTTDKTMES